MFLYLSFLLSFSLVLAKHEMYDGHSLFEIKIQDVNQIELVRNLEVPLQIDIWTYSQMDKKAVILVPKKNLEQFQDVLNRNDIQYNVDVDNIKRLMDEEDRLMDEAKKGSERSGTARIGFDRIYNLTEVYTYLEEVASSYPDLVTLVNAGKSFEGRDIKYLKISTTNFEDTSKPIVFVESLLHAREWVTLPPTLYAIDKLVTGNLTERSVLDKIDWIILPIANPDGYEFTHVQNRFWRKNRATGYMINDICVGVDLNRNFDANWGAFSSSNVCSEIFHGRYAFSEPESKVVRDILRTYGNRTKMFMDIHSAGSMILYGWGNGVLVPNALSVHTAGIQMAVAINAVKTSWNPNYIVGNSALVLYQASGLAMDYATVADVPYSFVYELPQHRNSAGITIFLVDPALVQQFAMETWEGILAGAKFVRDIYT
ncbi:carboxypeptidase B-like [Bicyclus anynana]|uniref:Carboxypeptidase B-like n=1 Tax=Bicyclus anynana TaxID=110368 RepID=A0ABM3LZL0_BICAN|nr:carboxypeptidase B-like [Bicyclus anynana]